MESSTRLACPIIIGGQKYNVMIGAKLIHQFSTKLYIISVYPSVSGIGAKVGESFVLDLMTMLNTPLSLKQLIIDRTEKFLTKDVVLQQSLLR